RQPRPPPPHTTSRHLTHSKRAAPAHRRDERSTTERSREGRAALHSKSFRADEESARRSTTATALPDRPECCRARGGPRGRSAQTTPCSAARAAPALLCDRC